MSLDQILQELPGEEKMYVYVESLPDAQYVPKHQGRYAKWKLSWNIRYDIYTCLHDVYSSASVLCISA